MFRIRRAFWSGVAILQVSDGDRWRDADVTPQLEDGFRIVGVDFVPSPQPVPPNYSLVRSSYLAGLQARITLYERRAATARRSRRKAKGLLLTEVPVLRDVVAERVVAERFVDTQPGALERS